MTALKDELAKSGVFTYPLDVPIDAGNRNSIDVALWAIESQIDCDECYCEVDVCTDESPRCNYRKLCVARTRLLSILEPVHRSLNPDRLSHIPELIFLRVWQKLQEKSLGLNHGYSTIEYILSPTRVPPHRLTDGPFYIPPVSQRDAEVAATVIQWLGTNGGLSLMREAERQIVACNSELNAVEREKMLTFNKPDRVLPMEENLARNAAKYAIRADDPKFEPLVKQIIAAIQAARKPLEDQVLGGGI